MDGGKSTDDLGFHSQLTLQTMLNSGGDATAGHLREQVGLEQTAQIHYRMDEWLIPLGLAVDTGEMAEYGGHESTVYALTDDGEEYALNHNLDLAPELHRAQLEDAVGQLRDHITAVNANARTANENARRAAEEVDDLSKRVSGFEGEAKRLNEKVEHTETRLTRLNDLLSDDNIENRIEELEKLESRVETLEEQVGDAGQLADEYDEEALADVVASNREYIIKIWNTVGVGQFKQMGETVYNLISRNEEGGQR